MHYTGKMILDTATDIGEGWRRTELTLTGDDTADSAVSSKWNFRGPGAVTYLIHASGWHVTSDPTITRSYV